MVFVLIRLKFKDLSRDFLFYILNLFEENLYLFIKKLKIKIIFFIKKHNHDNLKIILDFFVILFNKYH